MRLSRRRIIVATASTAVVATLTSVSTFALADDGAQAAAPPVHLIVGYKPGTGPAAAVSALSAAGARVTTSAGRARQALAALNAQTVQVPSSSSAGAIAALKQDPSVAYVEVDRVAKATDLAPNDPQYVAGNQPELDDVKLPAAWSTTTGSAVKIAVVDTGVTQVGDLTGAVLGGYDFVNNDSDPSDDLHVTFDDGTVEYGHGTTVAALIAGRGNDGAGAAGVCWKCTILPVKVLDSQGVGYESTIAQGIVYATDAGAKVINMSLGGPAGTTVLANAVQYATDRGVLVVAAASNSNTTARSYPAAYPDVLAVGATTTGSDARAFFSNYNSATDHWVDVAAPGMVTGMDPSGVFSAKDDDLGTSFSTPIVSGIGGLVQTVHPTYNGWSLMHSITASSRSLGSWVTYGIPDAAKALTIGTDTTLPTITGAGVAAGAKVHGVLTVKPAGVGDNLSGVRIVELYVDGTLKTSDRSAPYELKYDTKGRNGTVHLQIKVSDRAGNVRYYNRDITADNTPPTVKITKAPKSGSKVKGTVKISYTGSDKYGVKNYQLVVNGKVVQTHTSTKTAFSFVASKYSKNITVQVRATDIAGNVKYTSKLSYHR